ncbi:type II toxin-antitoxin system HicA family toxin [Mucilaginibacter sp.]
MKIPRNLSAQELLKMLNGCGYQISRQKGSHIRLSRTTAQGDQHLTVPNHSPLKLGTLSHILNEAAAHLNISHEQLLEKL